MFTAKSAFSGFSVDDAEKAKAFYGDTLGLAIHENPAGMMIDLPGGTSVFAYPKGADHQPASFTILNFEVADIDQAVDDLISLGVTFEHYDNMPGGDEKGIMRGRAANMGPDIAWFKDPAGNVLSVMQQ
jgi:catechol 2,3-dioxygenase-like lactoylglutathione lyase family enzyme